MKKIRALLYCTKAKPYLYKEITEWSTNPISYGLYARTMGINTYLNGTIVAECEIEVEEIYYLSWMNEKLRERILKQSCLTDKQFNDYMENKDTCYALHISNLKVFDKPYKLGESLIYNWESQRIVEKAPQNMCRVYNRGGDGLVLISVQPQWLCKILNGEKTIEVRKQILNCMKESE